MVYVNPNMYVDSFKEFERRKYTDLDKTIEK